MEILKEDAEDKNIMEEKKDDLKDKNIMEEKKDDLKDKNIMEESKVEEDLENVMVCPFFYYSLHCKAGENCGYAHTMTKILPENVLCEAHQRGDWCKYRNKCFFSHGTYWKKKKAEMDDTDPSKVKMRFSFVHKGILEKKKSYVQACYNKLDFAKCFPEITKFGTSRNDNKKLSMERCVYYDVGKCPLNDFCPCVHGKYCDLCQKYCLDPHNKDQQVKHIEECEKEFLRDMELSFALQCSRDKVCGICLEVVFDKDKICSRRFGILENCNHVFCLECIRRWRRKGGVMYQDMVIDQQVQRKCPQCRVPSDFIIPSNFWFYSIEEKTSLIEKYKSNLKSKHCKYFSKGEGRCPFGNRCFYMHALPDGAIVELPPPDQRDFYRPNRRDLQRAEELMFWEYLDRSDEGISFFIDDQNDVFIL